MSAKKRFRGRDEDLRERVIKREPFHEDPAKRDVVVWSGESAADGKQVRKDTDAGGKSEAPK